MTNQVTIKSLGDAALIVQLGEGISPVIHKRVRSLQLSLETQSFKGFIEAVPAYNNVTIYYNPFIVHQAYPDVKGTTSFQKVSLFIQEMVTNLTDHNQLEESIITIPVLYGGQWGPDLEDVAHHNDLTPEEVIQLHSSEDYLVYMIGFAPGFPFLGGMDKRIATPRRETPRLTIPAGSVGIAGEQTGVYPLETPGGWQIIGRTPLDLFLPKQSPPTLLQSGNKVRFVPITMEAYNTYKEGNR